MAWWFAVQAGAAAVSLIQNEKASKAAHGAAQRQAELYDKQAERIMEAAGEQIRNVQFQGQKLEGAQTVAYAASGVDVSSGSALSVVGDTHRQLNAEISSIRREAEFQSEMVRSGAQLIREQAEDLRKAQQISNYAGAFTQVASAYSNYAQYQALNKPELLKIQEHREEFDQAAKELGFKDGNEAIKFSTVPGFSLDMLKEGGTAPPGEIGSQFDAEGNPIKETKVKAGKTRPPLPKGTPSGERDSFINDIMKSNLPEASKRQAAEASGLFTNKEIDNLMKRYSKKRKPRKTKPIPRGYFFRGPN